MSQMRYQATVPQLLRVFILVRRQSRRWTRTWTTPQDYIVTFGPNSLPKGMNVQPDGKVKDELLAVQT